MYDSFCLQTFSVPGLRHSSSSFSDSPDYLFKCAGRRHMWSTGSYGLLSSPPLQGEWSVHPSSSPFIPTPYKDVLLLIRGDSREIFIYFFYLEVNAWLRIFLLMPVVFTSIYCWCSSPIWMYSFLHNDFSLLGLFVFVQVLRLQMTERSLSHMLNLVWISYLTLIFAFVVGSQYF